MCAIIALAVRCTRERRLSAISRCRGQMDVKPSDGVGWDFCQPNPDLALPSPAGKLVTQKTAWLRPIQQGMNWFTQWTHPCASSSYPSKVPLLGGSAPIEDAEPTDERDAKPSVLNTYLRTAFRAYSEFGASLKRQQLVCFQSVPQVRSCPPPPASQSRRHQLE